MSEQFAHPLALPELVMLAFGERWFGILAIDGQIAFIILEECKFPNEQAALNMA